MVFASPSVLSWVLFEGRILVYSSRCDGTTGLDVPTSCYSFRHLFYSSLSLYFKLDFAFKTDETSGGASQAAGASVQTFWAVRCARPIGCSYLGESGVQQQYFTTATACVALTSLAP